MVVVDESGQPEKITRNVRYVGFKEMCEFQQDCWMAVFSKSQDDWLKHVHVGDTQNIEDDL